MEAAKALVQEEDALQARIESVQEELSSMGITAKSSLIDEKGYPRADVDVYAARHLQNELSCLRNDHKAKLVEVEAAIHAWHSSAPPPRESPASQDGHVTQPSPSRPAFLRVEVVTPGSPAADAKLLPGDRVVQFGSITATNFGSMQDVAKLVQHAAGKTLRIDVQRAGRERSVELVPNRWAGQGLLGYVGWYLTFCWKT
eukprot:m.131131 g.131131  ORF g.131131 m.131131 type:complete len:200 (+) comp15901_c0_seq3:2062-2661(+)